MLLFNSSVLYSVIFINYGQLGSQKQIVFLIIVMAFLAWL